MTTVAQEAFDVFMKRQHEALQAVSSLPGPADADAVAVHLSRGRVLFCGCGGSRLFGLEDEHSDADTLIVWAAAPRDLLSLNPPKESIKGTLPDWIMHEARRFVQLLLQSDHRCIELLFADQPSNVANVHASQPSSHTTAPSSNQPARLSSSLSAADSKLDTFTPESTSHTVSDTIPPWTAAWAELRSMRQGFITRELVRQYLAHAEGELRQMRALARMATKQTQDNDFRRFAKKSYLVTLFCELAEMVFYEGRLSLRVDPSSARYRRLMALKSGAAVRFENGFFAPSSVSGKKKRSAISTAAVAVPVDSGLSYEAVTEPISQTADAMMDAMETRLTMLQAVVDANSTVKAESSADTLDSSTTNNPPLVRVCADLPERPDYLTPQLEDWLWRLRTTEAPALAM